MVWGGQSHGMQRMPFGRHKGERLEDIPTDYLEWCASTCKNLRPPLRAAILRELQGRGSEYRQHSDPDPPHRQQHNPPPVDVSATVAAWFRRMALEFHPDRGGSNDAMRAVNRGLELLKELLGVKR